MRFIKKSRQIARSTVLLCLGCVLSLTTFALTGCATKGSGKSNAAQASAPSTPATEAAQRNEGPERVFENFHANNFTHPTVIDNAWLPLKPGKHWVFEGATTEDGETLSHRVEFTVTNLTKLIAGVQTLVALEIDYAEDEAVEKELAFFAQDNDGNVWHLGQYPEEYDNGEFVKAPTWLAGIDGAQPGISMKAQPRLGTPSYFQGWGPAVGWTDYGRVDKMGEKICVPAGCYEDVMIIAESALDEVNAFQLKYYARGVGNIRVGWRGSDATKEELALIKFTQLDPQALAKVENEVLELEKHAYEISPKVYALTTPISGGNARNLPQRPVMLAKKSAAHQSQNISGNQAKEIALKAVPGVVMDVSIEKKLGAKRYVVEVIEKEDGSETDVIIDMETGKVLATEK